MQRQLRIADAHGRHFPEGRLQRRHQLGFQHTVQTVPLELIGDIAAHILIEEDRIADPVGILAEAADGDLGTEADILIHDPERHRGSRAVFVAEELFGIDVIDTLVLARISAEGKAAAHSGKAVLHGLAQCAGENAGLCRSVINKFTGLGANLRDLALIHDQHALAIRHRNNGAGGNNIVAALGIGGTGGDPLLAPYRQHRLRKCVTIKILLPLVSQDTAGCAQCSFDKTHSDLSLYILNFDRAYSRSFAILPNPYREIKSILVKKCCHLGIFAVLGNSLTLEAP